MPRPTSTSGDQLAAFARALATELDEDGRSQQQLAAALSDVLGERVGQTSVSTARNGKFEPTRPLVFAFEAILNLTPGTLSRILGYLPVTTPDPPTTPEVIAGDLALSAQQRRALTDQYEAMVSRTAQRRTARHQPGP